LRGLGFDGGLPEVLEQAGPGMRTFYQNVLAPDSPNAISEQAYKKALDTRRQLQQTVREYFTRHQLDALVFPTVMSAAPPIGDDAETTIDGKTVPLIEITGHNQSLAPVCALPALTLPTGLTQNGLPVGIEFEAASGEDEKLLRLGLSLEEALGPLPRTTLD
ncbi:MAG: amidase family protein, partial [Gammaproteobacteria bacterium]